jgi:protein ImuA
MSGARTSALAALRGQIERIETAEVVHHRDRVALGHSEADSALKGGLARAAIHEVFCEGRQGAAATGFVTGLAGRMTARKPLLWVR